MQTKNGSEHTTSGPLFIPASSFDLLAAHLVTLLLIGGRLHVTQILLSKTMYPFTILRLVLLSDDYTRSLDENIFELRC